MHLSIPENVSLVEYVAALERGDHEAAEKSIAEQLTRHPFVAGLHFLRASEAMQSGNADRAEAGFNKALALDAQMHLCRFQLGLLQFSSGRTETALETWSPLEALGESHYLVSFKRGFAALLIDALDDAMLLMSHGIEDNTENPVLNHDMRMVVGHIRQIQASISENQSINDEPAAMGYMLASYKNNL